MIQDFLKCAMRKRLFTIEEMRDAGRKDIIDFATQHYATFTGPLFSFDEYMTGLVVELEHKDITQGSLDLTSKIALAHLKENPGYYKKLLEVGL